MDNNPPLGAATPEQPMQPMQQPMQPEQPMQPIQQPMQPMQPEQPMQPIQQPMQQPMQPVQPMQQPTNANNKSETPGLVIGIISIVLAISIFGSVLALILSIIGIVINSSYLKHGGTKKTGLILSIVSLVLSIGVTIIIIFSVITLFGVGPLGTWSCEAISISSGKPIPDYTTEIELGLNNYKISSSYDDQKMIISGSGVSTRVKGKSNEELHYTIELDKPSEATVNGETDSGILNSGISDLEMVVNINKPNESFVVLEDSLRMFQCKRK